MVNRDIPILAITQREDTNDGHSKAQTLVQIAQKRMKKDKATTERPEFYFHSNETASHQKELIQNIW